MNENSNQQDISRLRIDRDPAPAPAQERHISWKVWGALGAIVVLVLIAIVMMGVLKGPVEVEVGTPTLTYPGQANAVLTANGYVVAQKKAAVASKGTGRLVYLGVEEGDVVKQGQIIARLEDSDVQAALDKARADLAVTRSDDTTASRTLARTKQLFDRGLASQSDLDAAQAQYDRVHASIISSEANVRAAEVEVENTRIRAPFDGTVLTKDADVGEVMAPFAAAANSRGAVVTMADMTSLQVEADVSESNIVRVNVGQPCEIVLDAYPAKTYRGVVHKIVPTADRSKATVLTKIAFLNRDRQVLPEMSAKVTFLGSGGDTLAGGAPFLTVPSAAVVHKDGSSIVYLDQDGKAIGRSVVTGRTLENRTEVTQGVTSSDHVILNPHDNLKDGVSVVQKTQ